ncbi:hypothetical protein SDC9_47095 [bioreactor metagenome]|uniref:Uncharacterized protein n=1 Tax=bioreactor metagenome TaxID=1076179 RepID=A0A644WAT7_9ZZZZ
MPEFLQGGIDGIDSDKAVALGNRLRLIAFLQVVVLQVIGHSDQHVAVSLAVG